MGNIAVGTPPLGVEIELIRMQNTLKVFKKNNFR